MAIQPLRPIYDTYARINNFTTYPYKEGQVYFASDKNQLFVDTNGQRAAQSKLASIGVLDDVNEIYEKSLKGFEGQVLTAKTSNGYRLFYVDNEAQVHNLTFTAEDLGNVAEDGFQGGALTYSGAWSTGKQYFADEFRTSVVKNGSNFYYATETHTSSGTFSSEEAAGKWIKFSIQFTSVATSLLLAEDAVITKTLVIGTEGTDIGTIRSTGATALNTGTGFFMSNTSNGVFRIGNPSGNFIRWDGSSLTINAPISIDYANVTGTKPPANADSTSTVISGGLITTGTLQVSQGGTVAGGITGNDSGDTAVRFFAGSTFANRYSAPFRVWQDGTMVASKGAIGRLNVSSNSLYYGNLGIVTPFSGLDATFVISENAGIVAGTTVAAPGSLSSGQRLALIDKTGIELATGGGGGLQFFTSTPSQGNIAYIQSPSGNMDITANSIYLKYRTGGGVFVTNPSGTNFFVSTTGGNISSKIIKNNIDNLDYDKILEFIEKVTIKEYYNEVTKVKELSLIIEDEELNNNPFINLITEKTPSLVFFNILPDYLQNYENDEEVIQKEYQGENVKYTVYIKSLKLKEYISATLAATKLNHNRIKQLETENEQLKARLDAIEAKLKD
jgi:hypothetical protein